MIRWYKFKKDWVNYILQCSLAGLAILIITVVVGQDRVVVISSIAATTFICFAMPKSYSAQTIRVVGGHLIGLCCGALFTLIHITPIAEYPIVVGLAIFLMVVLDCEHPPAAGTALAVTINEVTLNTAIAIMIAVLVVSQLRYYMRHWLKDLV